MKITPQANLVDVARNAGVSLATASRVINGGDNVSTAKVKIVLAAVKQLAYQPNHAARVLKGRRTNTVGLLVPSIRDLFFSTCAESAEAVARQHDSLLILALSHNDPAIEFAQLANLMRHRPDGLLIAPSDPKSKRFLGLVRASPVPIVTFTQPVSGCSCVLTDNHQAARNATIHLLEHGYRHILCCGSEPHLFTTRERVRGYRDAMKKAGLAAHIDVSCDTTGSGVEMRLTRLLGSSKPPDALFTLGSTITVAALQVARRLHIAVPRGIGMLGFDDYLLADTVTPPISVVRQPIVDIGRNATELLFEQVSSKARVRAATKRQRRKTLVLPCELVIRSSCGC